MLELTERFTKGNANTKENTCVYSSLLILTTPNDSRTRMTMTSREDIMRDPTIFFLPLHLQIRRCREYTLSNNSC